MKEGVTPYTSRLLKVLLHRVSDEDSQVKSNAAFAVGMLVENSEKTEEIIKAYPAILSKLEPLLHTQEARQLDNAAGCVARMVLKYPEHVPLDEVLPALVDLLPLKEDYEENIPVWLMVVELYKTANATIQRLSPQIMSLVAKVLGPPEEQLTDETREQLRQLVKYIYSKQPALIQAHGELVEIVRS